MIREFCTRIITGTPWQTGKPRKTPWPWPWGPGGLQARQRLSDLGGLTGTGRSSLCAKRRLTARVQTDPQVRWYCHWMALPHLQGKYTAAMQLLFYTHNCCCIVPSFDILLNFLFWAIINIHLSLLFQPFELCNITKSCVCLFPGGVCLG